MTIPELLVKDGEWPSKTGQKGYAVKLPWDVPMVFIPTHEGLAVYSDGKGLNTKVTNNGDIISGVYKLKYEVDAVSLAKLTLWAHVSKLDIKQLSGITNLKVRHFKDE